MFRARLSTRLLCALCVFCGAFTARHAAAYSTQVAPLAPEWMVDRWTVDDGLPLDHLSGLALAPDGSLWLASADGLARFDGDSFRTLRRANVPELPSNRFVDVVAMDNGEVWALTDGGALVRIDGELAVYRPGIELAGIGIRFHRTTRAVVSPSAAPAGAPEQTLWLATTAGLVQIAGTPGAADPTIVGETIAFAPDGTRWSGGTAGVFRTRVGAAPELVLAQPVGKAPLFVIAVEDDGTVWVGGGGLYVIRGDVVQPIATRDGLVNDLPCAVARRPDGGIEVRSINGWWRVEDQVATRIMAFEAGCKPELERGAPWGWRLAGNRLLRGDEVVFVADAQIAVVLPARGRQPLDRDRRCRAPSPATAHRDDDPRTEGMGTALGRRGAGRPSGRALGGLVGRAVAQRSRGCRSDHRRRSRCRGGRRVRPARHRRAHRGRRAPTLPRDAAGTLHRSARAVACDVGRIHLPAAARSSRSPLARRARSQHLGRPAHRA